MMDIVKVLRDPELIPHKRALLPAAISNAADEIERLRAVVGSIERVAACGTAEAFLGISDDGKRLHFAMSVRDAGRLKKAQEEIERLRAELLCVCKLLIDRGRHAEDGKYCEICEVVARARKIAAASKGEGE